MTQTVKRADLLPQVFIGVGVLLRFLWLSDFEYKGDQIYSFQKTQEASIQDRYPALGMPSSLGVRNPGASVWIFSALADVTAAKTPEQLTWAVVAWSALGLLGFWVLVRRRVPSPDRSFWLWGLAAMAVSPQALRFHRVIWAQSVLLPFAAACFFCFFYRKRFWGALGLGFFGMLMGQIHMPGFFALAAGIGALAIHSARSPRRVPAVNVRGLMAGLAVSTVLMVPWIVHVFSYEFSSRGGHYWQEVSSLKYWLLWFSEPFTDGFRAILGPEDARRFFGVSWMFQIPLALLGLGAAGIALRWRKIEPFGFALLGYGLLLTVLGVSIYRHYLLVVYPLPYVFAAKMFSQLRPTSQRWVYPVWVVCLAALSIQLLAFLHENGGAPHGDYGRAGLSESPPALHRSSVH